jgi:hypothetical protein
LPHADPLLGNPVLAYFISTKELFMNDKPEGVDSISVGNITNAQGVAIGRQATAITGQNIANAALDPKQLRTALESLYDALGEAQLPREHTRAAQTAAGNAISALDQKEGKSDAVVENVKRIGDTLKEANVAVREGTSLWESVKKLAILVGPLVGGARVVASWFGISL